LNELTLEKYLKHPEAYTKHDTIFVNRQTNSKLFEVLCEIHSHDNS